MTSAVTSGRAPSWIATISNDMWLPHLSRSAQCDERASERRRTGRDHHKRGAGRYPAGPRCIARYAPRDPLDNAAARDDDAEADQDEREPGAEGEDDEQ